MKQFFLYSLILPALCIGCSDSLPEKEDGDNYLRLESVELPGENLTKALELDINNVNVYVRKKDGDGTYSDYITESGKVTQTRFTHTSNNWVAANNIALDDPAYILGCYPVAENDMIISDNGILKIPVKILETNTFDAAKSEQNDYLYSSEAMTSGNQRSIKLEMHHALAQVSFYILKSSDVSDEMKLKQIEISSRNTCLQKGEGQMLLEGGTLAGISITNSLILRAPNESSYISLKSQEPKPNVTCLVAPMSAEESSLSFNLTVDVAGTERTFTTSSTNANWQKGVNYSYTITLNKIGGELSGIIIKKWETDASPNTSIGI